MRNIFKRCTLVILVLSLLLPLCSCRTAGKHWYKSKDESVSMADASNMIVKAQAVTDAFSNIMYDYSFFIELEAPNGDFFRLGTQNELAFSGRGTPSAAAYRKNTYTSIGADSTVPVEISEEHFLENGYIYTTRYGDNYRSSMNDREFAVYTEYSDISVNLDYLNEAYFEKGVKYELFGDRTELVFEGANDYIKSGIAMFTGLDQTDYEYNIRDIALCVLIEEDGSLSEKHLTFEIDYYSPSDPTTSLTYEGDFSFTVLSTDEVAVKARDKSVFYADMPNISLLSSLTDKGYATLLSFGDLDVMYSKFVKVSDVTTKEYVFDADAHITTSYLGGRYYYASVDSMYASTDKKQHATNGLFWNGEQFRSCRYDHVKGEKTSDSTAPESRYTDEQYRSIIANTILSEQIAEAEIASVTITENNSDAITYRVMFTGQAARLYASYLMDTFSESGSASGINIKTFSLNKCDMLITVRKSDGCIVSHKIDYSANITGEGMMGTITVEMQFEMNVLSTGGDIEMLEGDDFEAAVLENKNR